ncbi:YggS family pyridoxal phosphate-dependent enzyme [Xanthomonas albilineans]|nr:YggS family pyridoxal phosphate-dependent enzyme [Xanthomonas albilineans]PPU93168.1 YggS family pyridoxal phosphate-dependent enzyme [Xanthomonas albilineans]
MQQIRLDMERAADAAGRPPAQLLAVSKTQTAAAVAALAAQGQRAFGENYVQEAADKVAALAEAGLEWHLIGHLQSNKAELAATLFDWVQSVDRPKLIAPLAKGRPSTRGPLNVLIQVNIDDEASKHGCHPDQIEPLAIAIAAQPALALRGLMAIPAPWPEAERREAAFIRMRTLFEHLRDAYPRVDTLSMGMSGDFAQAIAAGATLVRIGTALFGARGDASPRA